SPRHHASVSAASPGRSYMASAASMALLADLAGKRGDDRRGVVGLHPRRANEVVEMGGEFTNELGRREHQIHVADEDHGAAHAKHRIWHRKMLAGVEQVPAIGGIEPVEHLGHVLDLLAALLRREAAPHALAAGEGDHVLQRRADLDLALRAPGMLDALAG